MRADASSGQQLLKHACGHSRRQAVDSNHACSIKSQRLGCLLGLGYPSGYLSGCVGIFFKRRTGGDKNASEGNNGAAESNVESQYSSCPKIAHRLHEKPNRLAIADQLWMRCYCKAKY